MLRRLAASTCIAPRTAAAVLACLLGAWCAPGVASSGVSIQCDGDGSKLPDTRTGPVPTLVAHTDSALQDMLDDDVNVPALAETTSDTVADDSDDAEPADKPIIRSTNEAPVINTRLPGVSESVLPSFRRQMYRTDI